MAAFNVTYIVDDRDKDITFLCPVNKQSVRGPYYNGTWTTIADQSCGQGWFQYKFNGTGIHVAAPMSKYGQQATVKIDDGDTISPYGRGIWDSSELSDGDEHTLTWAVQDEDLFPAFDYLTVTAGSSTPLDGRAVVVDDSLHGTNGPLSFQGSWSIAAPETAHFDYTTVPFWQTAHWTNQVGDTMSLQFMGTSVTVYGVLPNVSDAGITTTYTVDGDSSTLSLPTSSANKTTPMVTLFHANLKPGNHSLLLNITEVTSADSWLGIDMIIFNSSANDVASLGWDGFSGVKPSTSGSLGNGNGHSTNVGAIVGGVVGGVVLLLLAAGLGLLLRRCQRPTPSRLPQRKIGAPIVLTRLHDDDVDSLHDSKPRMFDTYDLEAPLPVLSKH